MKSMLTKQLCHYILLCRYFLLDKLLFLVCLNPIFKASLLIQEIIETYGALRVPLQKLF